MLRKQISRFGLAAAMAVMSGTLWAGTPYTLEVPKVASDAIAIDGKLDEGVWSDPSGTLTFGAGGIEAGFDNEDSYNVGGVAEYNDMPTQIIKVRHDGQGKIFISMQSNDKDIQSQLGAPEEGWWFKCDSDGMGNFVILQKGTTDQYVGVVLTFYPMTEIPEQTVVTSQAGTIHANDARGTTWDWSFLPGNNTVNKIDDVDTGYIIECVVDLTQFGYVAADTDIKVGIKNSDHDGPQDNTWPWDASYAHVFQWSKGSYAVDYGIDHLILSDKLATGGGEVTAAAHWALY